MEEGGREMNFMVSLRGGCSFGLNGAFWNGLFVLKGLEYDDSVEGQNRFDSTSSQLTSKEILSVSLDRAYRSESHRTIQADFINFRDLYRANNFKALLDPKYPEVEKTLSLQLT